MKELYNQEFYLDNRIGSVRSASKIIPIIMNDMEVKSVVDVGCGTGTWLAQFKKNGIEDIYGFDGEWVDKEMLMIPKEKFEIKDLNEEIQLNRKFDLAISLEVAEHIEEQNADKFVKTLTNLSNFIVFSAAIPFQGGVNHINENWQQYWIDKFKTYGYVVSDVVRRKIWGDNDIEMWYCQNILVFKKAELISNCVESQEYSSESYNIIHPKLHFQKSLQVLEKIYLNKEYNVIEMLSDIDNPYENYFLGRVYIEKRQYDVATRYFEKFLKGSKVIFKYLDSNYILSNYFYCGISYFEQKNMEDAKKCFENCMMITNNNHKKAQEYLDKIKLIKE